MCVCLYCTSALHCIHAHSLTRAQVNYARRRYISFRTDLLRECSDASHLWTTSFPSASDLMLAEKEHEIDMELSAQYADMVFNWSNELTDESYLCADAVD